MTESRFALSLNGQALQKDDLNTIAEQAARAGDWSLWDLLRTRTRTTSSTAPFKAIIPTAGEDSLSSGSASDLAANSVITSSLLSDAKIRIRPFTAVIGALPAASGKDSLRDIRTATHFGDTSVTTFGAPMFYTELQIPGTATPGTSRWDCIWVKVDVDVASEDVTRYVKSGDGPAVSQLVSLFKDTKLTIGRTAGVETAGTPARPVAPADSGGSYYIILGWVFVPAAHTLSTLINPPLIHESFVAAKLASSHGVSRIRPAQIGHSPSFGPAASWSDSSNKPRTFLPASMVGGEAMPILLAAHDASGGVNAQPNANTSLDLSVDWRNRYFKVVAQAVLAAAGTGYPSDPSAGSVFAGSAFAGGEASRFGQSFKEDCSSFTGGVVTNGAAVWAASDATSPGVATGAKILVYVNLSSGGLWVWRNNVDAARHCMLWLEATAPYNNFKGP